MNYNDLDYLGAEEVSRLGSHNVTSVQVTGVAEALQKNTAEDIETKVLIFGEFISTYSHT